VLFANKKAVLENHDLQQNVTELCKIVQVFDMKISNNKSKAMAMERRNTQRIQMLQVSG
jgi:hypothetical protein